MLNNIFDTHAHYDDKAFEPDRRELLERVFSEGVDRIINCGCTVESSRFSIELAKKYPGKIYSAVGIHPQNAADEGLSALETTKELSKDKSVVAIGEIGLDYHYDYTPRQMQIEFFEKQIALSLEIDKPVIVHDREAHRDVVDILLKHRPKGVLHCFSGSVETANELIKAGFYIGLGGSVTFKNAVKPASVAASIPLDRILLETDCPYMAPVPLRGRRNDSSLIRYTAEKIAILRNTDPQTIIDAANENAKRLFGIKE